MARVAQGWTLRAPEGIFYVRFSHAGRRHEISTGARDSVEAARRGARIYSDVVSGALRRSSSGALVHPATPLDELAADWIATIEPELGEGTAVTYEVYVRHWARVMPTIGELGTAGIGEYQRARLRHVTRSTLVKELSALRRFATWLVETGSLAAVPEFPKLPRKATGARHAQGRRRPISTPTPQEVEAILVSISRAVARDYFTVLWETALRPSTLDRLEPGDLGPAGLHIRAVCDKNRWERVVPISQRAREALARSLPFGAHDRRDSFERAVARAGLSPALTPYDLKHARITAWINEGRPLGGISFLTGVSIETLTKRYAHASRLEAELVLDSGGIVGE